MIFLPEKVNQKSPTELPVDSKLGAYLGLDLDLAQRLPRLKRLNKKVTPKIPIGLRYLSPHEKLWEASAGDFFAKIGGFNKSQVGNT